MAFGQGLVAADAIRSLDGQDARLSPLGLPLQPARALGADDLESAEGQHHRLVIGVRPGPSGEAERGPNAGPGGALDHEASRLGVAGHVRHLVGDGDSTIPCELEFIPPRALHHLPLLDEKESIRPFGFAVDTRTFVSAGGGDRASHSDRAVDLLPSFPLAE
jgi:hypothetical protein